MTNKENKGDVLKMKDMSRRNFGGLAGRAMIGGMASYSIPGVSAAKVKNVAKSNVFFTRDISVKGLVEIYSRINQGIAGKVGIKLHTG
jgi:hypothetical protein